jgi:hypothetical protein
MKTNAIQSIQRLGFPWVTADPFLFCAHHNDSFPAGNDQLGPAVSRTVFACITA